MTSRSAGTPLATIKVFDGEDDDAVTLSGWLDPDESGNQALFTEKRLKNCITQIAPVGNVLPVKMPDFPPFFVIFSIGILSSDEIIFII